MTLRVEVRPGIIQINLDDRRYYEVDGEYLPSITTILEAYPKGYGFQRWLVSQFSQEEADMILREAGDQGSRVHWGVEELLSGNDVTIDSIPYGYHTSFTAKEWKYLIAFMNWFEANRPVVQSIEETVVGDGWAGTADLIATIDGKTCLIDWKTSGAIYESYKCQVAGYAVATGIDQARIVRLGSRHKVGYEEVILEADEIKKYYELFLHVKAVWDHENPDPHPRFLEVPERLNLLDIFKGEENANS